MPNTETTERPYDIIVWGASGFTGQIVVDYMHREYGGGNLRWAVAGRNPAKLESVVGQRDIPVLTADSHDSDSLEKLVQQARVIWEAQQQHREFFTRRGDGARPQRLCLS
ncbi:MAG: hypothetical protein CMP82_11675, partial [Gammaproteobacteria bacterium]|nr:hypothetical protein [Gammaproteobacteria bacterium]